MVKVSRKSVAKPVRIDCCHRCGGLMVPESVHELGSYDWRCVSCGERIDPVILAHRQQVVVPAAAGQQVAGHSISRRD